MYKNFNDLKLAVAEAFTISDTDVTIVRQALVAKHIDPLAHTAMFSSEDGLRIKTQRVIDQLSATVRIAPSSLRPVYKAYAEGAVKGFSIPVFHLSAFSYDVARVIFRVAERQNAATFQFAFSEADAHTLTLSPDAYRTMVLAAAIREDYSGPVFLQSSHKRFDLQQYAQDKDAVLQQKKDWLKQALSARIYALSLDASGLVDATLLSHHAQQKHNAHVSAILTDFIRKEQPETDVLIGAQLGTTREETLLTTLEAFMTPYLYQIPRNSGISSIAVFPETESPIDFHLLQTLSKQTKQTYRIGVTVARDISLQTPFFPFVTSEVQEVHLSEAINHILLTTMPQDVKAAMGPLPDPASPPFSSINRQLWELPSEEKQPMIIELEKYVTMVFEQLHISNTRDVVNKYVPRAIR